MEKEKKISEYRVKKSFILGNSFVLIFPLVLTIVTFAERDMVRQNEWVGLGGFWMIGLLLTLLPLSSKLEISKDYVKICLFGVITTSQIYSSDVQIVEYGNLLRGGLGHGKGLRIRVLKNGRSRTHNIREKIFGIEAVKHAKRVLESRGADIDNEFVAMAQKESKRTKQVEKIGGIGIGLSIILFFIGLFIPEGSSFTVFKLIIPISAISIIFFIAYIIVKSKENADKSAGVE